MIYLNQPHVLQSLNFSSSFRFENVNLDLNEAFMKTKDPFLPTTRQISAILDSYLLRAGFDIRVLIMNGNDDYLVNTPGQIRTYDKAFWSNSDSYRQAHWAYWPEKSDRLTTRGRDFAGSGYWKQSKDARLVFVGVNGAGHAAPSDQKEATWNIFDQWLRGW